ncbi:MAG: hypothetical protein AB1297_07115, partial [bacterium]
QVGYYLWVDLSDTQLFWDIPVNAIFSPGRPGAGQDSARILAGSNANKGTGVSLYVYTTNEKGAKISFSQADDVKMTSGPEPRPTFPTWYGFTGTATVKPTQDELIRASALNSYTMTVPDCTGTNGWVRYLWSAIDVGKYSERGTYKDDLYITVANLP